MQEQKGKIAWQRVTYKSRTELLGCWWRKCIEEINTFMNDRIGVNDLKSLKLKIIKGGNKEKRISKSLLYIKVSVKLCIHKCYIVKKYTQYQ